MPHNRRLPSRLLVFTLALPIFALVYATTFGARLWAALRPAAATFLGATVIGSVYAHEAYRRAPATPMRAAAVLALAVALVGPGFAPAPARAGDPAEAVIAAAREYLGQNYRLGAEGPRVFDCSGLIFRVFSDTGELPRVGGMRLRAAGYMRWFTSRGLFSRRASEAQRGDLIVWNNGEHIGIYIGDGKALSALVNPWGVSVHGIDSINMRVTQILHVNWRNGDSGNNDSGNDNPPDQPARDNPPNQPGNDEPGPDNPQPGYGNGRPADNNGHRTSQGPAPANQDPDDDNSANPDGNNRPTAGNDVLRGTNAVATGTMNLRTAADPTARIIGWVGRGGQFKIVDRGNSPAGYLWFKVQTKSGKEGWLYSRWVQEI